MIVMEYPFSFWQAGQDHEKIPTADATHEELLDHIVDSGDFWYLLDESTENLAAHYYQHATQYGYYGYRPDRFGDLIVKWKGEPSACFFPYEHATEFDPSVRSKLIEWLKTDAKDIIFLYGSVDTWTVCQAILGDNKNVHKYIFEGKHHGSARLKNIDEALKDEILDLVRAAIAPPGE